MSSSWEISKIQAFCSKMYVLSCAVVNLICHGTVNMKADIQWVLLSVLHWQLCSFDLTASHYSNSPNLSANKRQGIQWSKELWEKKHRQLNIFLVTLCLKPLLTPTCAPQLIVADRAWGQVLHHCFHAQGPSTTWTYCLSMKSSVLDIVQLQNIHYSTIMFVLFVQ